MAPRVKRKSAPTDFPSKPQLGLKKRRKGGPAASDGRTRVLEQSRLTELPLDILLEVFRFLDPQGLLALARTSKALRGMLISRTSESIWEAAHKNAACWPLPHCPSWMSEPQLADLAFGSDCHRCGRHTKRHRFTFVDRTARYCSQCIPTVTVRTSHFDVRSLFGKDAAFIALADYLCDRNIHEGDRRRFFEPDVRHLRSIVERAEDEYECFQDLSQWKYDDEPSQQLCMDLEEWHMDVEKEARQKQNRANKK